MYRYRPLCTAILFTNILDKIRWLILKIKIFKLAGLSFIALFLIFARPAYTEVLYSNGAPNGEQNAFPIDVSDSQAVSDSFNLGQDSLIGTVDFFAWLNPLDTPTSVEALIRSSAFGGVVFADDRISSLSVTNLGVNSFGFELADISFEVPALPLPSGTYYLTLQNAQTSGDSVLFWDENDGPSQAFQATLVANDPPPGFTYQAISALSDNDSCSGPCTGSETFQIGSATPEPRSLFLLLSGFVLFALARRRNPINP